MKASPRSEIKFILMGIALMIVLLSVSLFVRKDDFSNVVRAMNQEASWHVLLTVAALDESHIENHFFLPTVSLGRVSDKGIGWGAARPTSTGDYVYTSFTAPGFVVPYLYFHLFGITPEIKELSRLNAGIGAISSLVIFVFLFFLATALGKGAQFSSITAVLAGGVSIFSREALLSHGVNYWSQSLYQLIFSLTLLCLLLSMTMDERRKAQRVFLYSTVVLAFFGAWTEWTGYVANFGIVTGLLLFFRERPSCRYLSYAIVVATMLSGLITILHFGLVLGFDSTLSNFIYRFTSRSVSSGSFEGLVKGYMLSFGLFLIPVCLLIFFALFKPSFFQNIKDHKLLLLFLLISIFPLFENIVLLQHAEQFSFDRLKFIFPAAIICLMGLVFLSNVGRSALILALMISCVFGVISYKEDIKKYYFWNAINRKNIDLKNQIYGVVDRGCTVIASDFGVRGYANLLFHSGIHEYKNIHQAWSIASERSACALVYLEGCGGDFPEYVKATVRYRDGQIKTFTPGALQCVH